MNAQRSFTVALCGLFVVVCSTLVGCGNKEPSYKSTGQPKVKLSLRLAKAEPFPGAEELKLPKECIDLERGNKRVGTLFVAKVPVLTNADLAGTSVSRQPHDPDLWQVEVFLTPAGRNKFAQFTRDNRGNWLAIYYDARFEMAPQLSAVITEGIMVIAGVFTETQATDLAKGLVGQ